MKFKAKRITASLLAMASAVSIMAVQPVSAVTASDDSIRLELVSGQGEDLSGYSFELIRYKGADTQSDVYMYDDKVTDESGYVEWDNLPDKDPKTGEKYYYEIGENNVPDQFRKPVTLYIGEFQENKGDDGNSEAIDLTLFGNGEREVAFTCYNQLKRSEFKIIKRDEETGEVIPLEGAQFQVYNSRLMSPASMAAVILGFQWGNSIPH